MSHSSLRRYAIALVLPGVLLPVMAAQRVPTRTAHVSGSATMTYSQQHVLPLSDAPGHMVAVFESKGSNRSTGPFTYMDGADVSNAETTDLIQGNGVNQGYIIFTKGGDTTYNKWSGKVSTTLNSEKKPVTTLSGTWTKSGGTGQYASIIGSGTFSGRMTSENSYTVDWSGSISGPNLTSK